MLNKSDLSIETAVANCSGAMEADTISKNGRSSKSQMSRRQFLFYFVVATFSISVVFTSCTKNVRFDGFYQTQSKEDYKSFLRFYSDSTVLSVTTDGDAEASNLISWFKKPFDNPHHSKGKYEIKENKISFTTDSSNGKVVYKGTIESENKLILNFKSLINGYEGKEVYYFIKLDLSE